MIVTLATTLIILAQPMPEITNRPRDGKGDSVYDYSRKPENQVHALHLETINKIYYPYFICYYNHLSADYRFGTEERKVAIEAMHSARSRCTEKRDAADLKAGKYLSKQRIYGDSENQRVVLERFRQVAGLWFTYATARLNGRGDEFDRMARAITNELVPPHD